MSERKNIDRLFQEKFKDFEVNPPEEIWSNIEANLEKDKTKRVIPLWWKLSGIAGLFLIGLLITQSVFNEKTVPPSRVTVDETKTTKEAETKSNGIIPTINTVIPKGENLQDAVVNNKVHQNNVTGKESKESSTAKAYGLQNVPKKLTGYNPSDNNAIVEEKLSNTNITQTNEVVASSTKTGTKEKSESEKSLVINNKAEAFKTKENANVLDRSKEISLESLKGSNKTVAETEPKTNPIDSTKTNETPKNPLEELLAAQKEDQKKRESKQSKWQIISNVSPIFMGALSGGSAIDSTLANNSKTFNTNVGFGLGVSYAVSPKLTIRTGLNKLNMSYNTNDVFYYASMQTRALNGLNPSGAGHTIQVENSNAPSPSVALATAENDLLDFEQNITHKNKGALNQEMGYLEMPVEMTYAVVAKRFGLKIIGGFSTLFLQDNSISVVSNNRTTVLGEANNLNNIHFSTNIGLGLKYDLLKSFEFHIEPTFKYQINTFSNDTGNFRPYLFGVYSGLSYKF